MRDTGIGADSVRTGEGGANASTNVQAFPIKTSSFVDRLRGGRDDQVSGLSTANEQRSGSNTERK